MIEWDVKMACGLEYKLSEWINLSLDDIYGENE